MNNEFYVCFISEYVEWRILRLKSLKSFIFQNYLGFVEMGVAAGFRRYGSSLADQFKFYVLQINLV